jgi:hypothetical protein
VPTYILPSSPTTPLATSFPRQHDLQAHLSLTSYEFVIKFNYLTLLYKSFMKPQQSFLKLLKSELKY